MIIPADLDSHDNVISVINLSDLFNYIVQPWKHYLTLLSEKHICVY